MTANAKKKKIFDLQSVLNPNLQDEIQSSVPAAFLLKFYSMMGPQNISRIKQALCFLTALLGIALLTAASCGLTGVPAAAVALSMVSGYLSQLALTVGLATGVSSASVGGAGLAIGGSMVAASVLSMPGLFPKTTKIICDLASDDFYVTKPKSA